jgi:hypothetical protein
MACTLSPTSNRTPRLQYPALNFPADRFLPARRFLAVEGLLPGAVFPTPAAGDKRKARLVVDLTFSAASLRRTALGIGRGEDVEGKDFESLPWIIDQAGSGPGKVLSILGYRHSTIDGHPFYSLDWGVWGL